MTAFFFGRSEAPLFGVYHAPAGRAPAGGVVLCPPFGQEYMRSHRACRQLAGQLSERGLNVLRFDYRGTGDSSGEMDDVRPSDWVQDIGLAVDELKDMAALDRVSLVGLRLGALLAPVAAAGRTDIDRLVLWDPVTSGRAYAEELRRAAARHAVPARDRHAARSPSERRLWVRGFPAATEFAGELETLALDGPPPSGASRVLHVASHEAPEFAALRARWGSSPTYTHMHVPAPHDWNDVDEDGILLPKQLLDTIVGWFDAEASR